MCASRDNWLWAGCSPEWVRRHLAACRYTACRPAPTISAAKCAERGTPGGRGRRIEEERLEQQQTRAVCGSGAVGLFLSVPPLSIARSRASAQAPIPRFLEDMSLTEVCSIETRAGLLGWPPGRRDDYKGFENSFLLLRCDSLLSHCIRYTSNGSGSCGTAAGGGYRQRGRRWPALRQA